MTGFFELLLRPRPVTIRATLRHTRDPELAARAFVAVRANAGAADPGGPVGADRAATRPTVTTAEVLYRPPGDLRVSSEGVTSVRSGGRIRILRDGAWQAPFDDYPDGLFTIRTDPLFWWVEFRQVAHCLEWEAPTKTSWIDRPALRAGGRPRRGVIDTSRLSGWAYEAQRVDVLIDAEHGVPLRVVSLLGDEPIETTEVLAIAYGEPLGDALFAAGDGRH